MRHNILLIDDNETFRKDTADVLEGEGFGVRHVESGEDAIALVRQQVVPFSIALVDHDMPGMNGPSTIEQIRKYNRELVIIGFSGHDTDEIHNQSVDSGAHFFISKDTSESRLLGILYRHCREIERKIKPLLVSSINENQKLIERLGMFGASEATADVCRLIEKFASSKENVLIRGENGTGKELVARALHQESSRKLMPFVAVNCAAVPAGLIESELFGHEKGAFTGANRARIGYFQAANGGTIFLDEIGELPLQIQATLLRVLQEKVVTPVGSNEIKKVDFRLIAATNANLEEMVREKRFREDLYYRLNVLPLIIRPLRERPEDIPALTTIFLRRANQAEGKNFSVLQSTVEELMKFQWPGNVRELEHCIRYLVNVSHGDFLDESFLNQKRLKTFGQATLTDLASFNSSKEHEEKRLVENALKRSGTIAGASRILGIARSSVREKMKKFKIEIRKFSAIKKDVE